MTVAALTPSVSYTEDGVTLSFPAPFRYLDPTHLLVTRTSAAGVQTVLAYGSEWSATAGATDAGGTLTLLASVAGSTLTIDRKTPRNQSTDYVPNDRFPAETHEAALDRAMLVDQEQDVDVARSIKVPRGQTGPILDMTGASPGELLQVSPSGGIQSLDASAFAGKFYAGDALGLPVPASGFGADSGLRTDLAAITGASLVGWKRSALNARNRTVDAKLADSVSVADFTGYDPTGVTDSSAAFKAARDFLAIASDHRGGVIKVGRGTFKLSDEWAFTPYVAGQVFNIIIEGEGPLATNLDFSTAAAGKHGISAIGQGGSFHIKDISINGAPVNGIVLKGGNAGSAAFGLFMSLDNVRVQGSGSDGIYSENSFMVDLSRTWSKNNTGAGFNFQGFHTSIKGDVSWASDNGDAGWRINGAIYCALNACGSDRNLYGYRLSNVTMALIGCGAEECVREGVALETGNSFNTGVPANARNVYLTMVGCYAVSNSQAGANAFANLLSCLTANAMPISVTMIGCVSRQGTSTTKAVALNAASGAVDVWGYDTLGNDLDSASVNVGGTFHGSFTSPKSILAPTTGATVTVTTAVLTVINPAGTLANLTIALPTPKGDGDTRVFTFAQAVTTLAWTGATSGFPTTAARNSRFAAVYDSGTSTWYPA